jgi:hypothetical protein
MRTLTKLVVAVLLLLALAYLGRDLLLREGLELGVRRKTGFALEVGAVDLSLAGGTLDLRELRLLNPPDVGERLFADVPSVHADYETRSLLSRRPHLRELVVEVKEVRVVTDARGERNTSRLARAAEASGRGSPPARYCVDLLRVHVGSVVIVDLSHGRRTERRTALDRTVIVHDLTESSDLTRLVLGTVIQQLGPALGDTARGLGDAVKGAGKGAGKAGHGLFDLFKRR